MIDKRCDLNMNFTDGVLEIKINGEIDHHSAVRIRGEIDEKINELRPQKSVIDLSGIEFMDSSGLGLVMGRYALMQRFQGELAVINPNERVRKIFELAGLDRIIKIEKSSKSDAHPRENASKGGKHRRRRVRK